MQVITRKLSKGDDIDFKTIARLTPGFVGADLHALAKEASIVAIRRIFSELENATAQDPSALATEPQPQPQPQTTELEKRMSVSARIRSLKSPLSEEQLKNINIRMEDFLQAIRKVQPSAKREGFATAPGVTWEDIGALGEIREQLMLHVIAPIRHPERFTKVRCQRNCYA